MKSKKTLVVSALILTSLMAVAVSLYAYEQYLRVLPEQTKLMSLPLSGLKRDEALTKVEHYLRRLAQRKYKVELVGYSTREFTLDELGISYDPQKTVAQIFSSTHWFAKAEELESDSHLPVVEYDEPKLESALKNYLVSPEKDFQNAQLMWHEKLWFIQPELPGLVMKEGELERVLSEIKKISELVLEPTLIQVTYESVEPLQKSPELEPALKIIQEKTAKPITVHLEYDKVTLSWADEQEWILFDPLDLSVRFNEEHAKKWIEQYASAKNIAPGQVSISALEEVISEYDGKPYKKAVYSGDFTHGRTIDEANMMSAFRTMFDDLNAERKLFVVWEDTLPTISSTVEGYQFPQILSTGVSSYKYGNHPNRVKNIKLSIGSFKGVVVNPGEEFSFNRVTGWITPNKGYTKTQVIMEGKVEEGVGGGVCQSSTTMYRSILNAGLQVTERRNHSLDIVYYHEYGYGLDAAVYTDSRNDLRFINNFKEPIIINTYTNDFERKAYVEFYGITDERRVELTQINTGDYLLKKWNWKIIWPDRIEEQLVTSRYNLPKEEEEKPHNPLEG